MKNEKIMPTNGNSIRKELLAILNKEEIISQFNEVFQKHGMSENKIVTIEFKFVDKNQLEFDDASPKNVRTLAAPIAPSLLQFGSTWCPAPPCPPPGRWLA